jgi:hypothetical protein
MPAMLATKPRLKDQIVKHRRCHLTSLIVAAAVGYSVGGFTAGALAGPGAEINDATSQEQGAASTPSTPHS